MTLPELIKHLEELEAKATPGEWEADHFGWIQAPTSTVLSAYHDGNFASEVDVTDADAALITQSRNALPTLLTALKEAMEVIEFYENFNEWDSAQGRHDSKYLARAFREKWGMK